MYSDNHGSTRPEKIILTLETAVKPSSVRFPYLDLGRGDDSLEGTVVVDNDFLGMRDDEVVVLPGESESGVDPLWWCNEEAGGGVLR